MATFAPEMKKQWKDENDQCSICLDPCVNPSRLECGHTFCSACLSDWSRKKKTCPTCRKEFNTFHTLKPNGEWEINYVPTPIIRPVEFIENMFEVEDMEGICQILQLWGDGGFQFILKTWIDNMKSILDDEISGLNSSDPEYSDTIEEYSGEYEALEFIPKIRDVTWCMILYTIYEECYNDQE